MSSPEPVDILTLQAFYGGSHRQFIDGWIRNSKLSWKLLSLPARHWKWRMRHSAIEFAERIDELWTNGQRWNVMLCTDMVNLAELKGLLKTDARFSPSIVYFHENQFEYPIQHDQPRDLHFAFTNFTTALAADQVWFNSDFNRTTMLDNLIDVAGHWPDFQPLQAIETIAGKALIQSPGIEVRDTSPDRNANFGPGRTTHIVWAARWEHDKNPDDLLRILRMLDETGFGFELSVIGQQFSDEPPAFETIRTEFSHRILNWGFKETREEYFEVIESADIFLSTANHEFFGISAVEAIACNCIPILPNRLSYPEVMKLSRWPKRENFLYSTVEDAAETIRFIGGRDFNRKDAEELSIELSELYSWPVRAREMDAAIERFMLR